MPKADRGNSGDESAPPHRAISMRRKQNDHRQKLEKTIDDLRRSAMELSIREIMGNFVLSIKNML